MQFGVRRACNRNSPLLLNMWCSVDLSFQLGMKNKLIRKCGLNNVVEDFLTLSLTVWFLTVSVQKLSHSSYVLYTIYSTLTLATWIYLLHLCENRRYSKRSPWTFSLLSNLTVSRFFFFLFKWINTYGFLWQASLSVLSIMPSLYLGSCSITSLLLFLGWGWGWVVFQYLLNLIKSLKRPFFKKETIPKPPLMLHLTSYHLYLASSLALYLYTFFFFVIISPSPLYSTFCSYAIKTA